MNEAVRLPGPLLEPEPLRSFVAICDTGSFAAAAERVHKTPSAVSMQIKKLEETLGRPLFVREARSVSLTRDGELLLEHGRRLLALNRDLVARFVTPDVSGEVRLGAPDDAAERFLPEMLKLFAETHPHVVVNVVVENTDRLVPHVRSGKVDIALVTCSNGAMAIEGADVLMREPLVWAMLKGGVAVERRPLPISVWEEGCVWRKAGVEGLDALGTPYRVAFQSAYISGQKAAILADLAIAPLPRSAISGSIVAAEARSDLPELPDYGLGMIVAPDPGPAVQAAADHLRASFAAR